MKTIEEVCRSFGMEEMKRQNSVTWWERDGIEVKAVLPSPKDENHFACVEQRLTPSVSIEAASVSFHNPQAEALLSAVLSVLLKEGSDE